MTRLAFPRLTAVLLGGCLLFQLVSCGTILYPERRGQQNGRIDPGVALLDGAGLLLFVIPGIIAYAVDFSTGAIYLPPGAASSIRTDGEPLVVRMSPSLLTNDRIAAVVRERTGLALDLDSQQLRILPMASRKQALNMVWSGRLR